jgi:uncharacterized protein YutE (UPF0331/DUF86 family)
VEVLENVKSRNQLVHDFSVRAHFIDDVIGGGVNTPQDLARKMCEETRIPLRLAISGRAVSGLRNPALRSHGWNTSGI